MADGKDVGEAGRPHGAEERVSCWRECFICSVSYCSHYPNGWCGEVGSVNGGRRIGFGEQYWAGAEKVSPLLLPILLSYLRQHL